MKYLLINEQTERLNFRLLVRNDFDTWLELFKTHGVSRLIGMEKIPTPEEQCEKWFELAEDRYKNDTGGMNVLIDRTTSEFIGQCGLLIQEVDGINEMEIGYSILPRYWNKGYATEAAQKCRDVAFKNNYADSLISIIHLENIRSKKVAVKNGMVFDKKTVFKDMPVNIFRIIRSDWLKNKSGNSESKI